MLEDDQDNHIKMNEINNNENIHVKVSKTNIQ